MCALSACHAHLTIIELNTTNIVTTLIFVSALIVPISEGG